MANVFPKWCNWLPIRLLACGVVLGTTVVVGMSYYFTPKYVSIGYQPVQPIAFDHSIHATQLGLDCRYCHTGVESSEHANIPNSQTCMNCHTQIRKDSPKLTALYDSWRTGQPIHWVRIHQLPDHVYFNHSVHVNRGISCVRCHGNVNHMQVVRQDQPLSMGWCLECHRHPEMQIRPTQFVFNLDWKPGAGFDQEVDGKRLVKEWNVSPPITCAGCHR